MIQDQIKIFLDSPNVGALSEYPFIAGFTTNPSILRKFQDKRNPQTYECFIKSVIQGACGLPISAEVVADEFDEMERQANVISSWGNNVYVKIPIVNPRGDSSIPLIRKLLDQGHKLNITGVMDLRQLVWLDESLLPTDTAILSIFAGRIADTGRDPKVFAVNAVRRYKRNRIFPNVEVLWASTREVFNIYQAADCGCQIITVTEEILKKLPLEGKNLLDYSIETVQQFHCDAKAAGFTL